MRPRALPAADNATARQSHRGPGYREPQLPGAASRFNRSNWENKGYSAHSHSHGRGFRTRRRVRAIRYSNIGIRASPCPPRGSSRGAASTFMKLGDGNWHLRGRLGIAQQKATYIIDDPAAAKTWRWGIPAHISLPSADTRRARHDGRWLQGARTAESYSTVAASDALHRAVDAVRSATGVLSARAASRVECECRHQSNRL
jgi:hypothetical protein